MDSQSLPIRLEFDSVSVYFGATRALNDLTMSIRAGEIVGLLGHNGAGKSTVLNVATGAVTMTSGSMRLDGIEVPQPLTPKVASDLGLTVIHQEPALAQNLSVLDNLLLMKDIPGGLRRRREIARATLAKVDASESIALEQPVSSLSLGMRQMVDLARGSLSGDARVLFLDEPTAALGDRETRALHTIVREFAARGAAIVYVSHRLPDILDVCTRIVVLRNGALVEDQPTAHLTPEVLARALAPELDELDIAPAAPGELVLEVEHHETLRFCKGEVVGLFGIAAGPQFDLLDRLLGPSRAVEATLGGAAYRPPRPASAIMRGVHLVPGDREQDGLVSGMSAFDNVALPWIDRRGTKRDSLFDAYHLSRRAFNVIGPGAEAPIAEFSGGNRQKHLLARWIFPVSPRVLLLSQPTQGVDISAKRDIRKVVRQLAESGCAVLVASAETDEIATLCDRAYVFSGDRTSELLKSADFDALLLSTLLALTDISRQSLNPEFS